MRTVLIYLFFVMLCGCAPSDSGNETAETVAKIELKETLIEAKLVTKQSPYLQDVGMLREVLHKQGKLEALNAYGITNLFFNPDLRKYDSDIPSSDLALLLRVGDKYLGIRFDWRLVSTQSCPVSWGK